MNRKSILAIVFPQKLRILRRRKHELGQIPKIHPVFLLHLPLTNTENKSDRFFNIKCTCTINCLFNIEVNLFCLINQNSSCIVQCTFQLYKFIFVCIVPLLTISNKEDGVFIFTNFFSWALVRAVKSLASKTNELGKVLLPIQPDWEKKIKTKFLNRILASKKGF